MMVYILITIVVMAAIVGIGYWRMSTFSRELLNQGMNAEDAEERRKYFRKAALLGNKEAILAYACTNPDMFAKPRMLPFDYYIGLHHFPCVFADHYFAKGLTRYIVNEQKAFMKRVYNFEGLDEDCSDLIEAAIRALGITMDGIVIVFMPCSNPFRFTNKFQHLCWKLQRKGYEANHLTYPYLSVRDQKSEEMASDSLMSHVKRIVGVENRKVLVVDDVINTGETLNAFAKELKKYKTKIVGAVFVSKVFNPPHNPLLAWLRIVFSHK